MTFNTGMHQVIEDKGVDFDAIMSKIAQAKPQMAIPLRGWGKKYYIQATLNKKGNRFMVEIFSELTFKSAPINPDIGYTAEEATLFQGVCVTDYDKIGNDFCPSQSEIVEYTKFVTRYIVDKPTRIILDRVMENMADAIAVNDQMIERINAIWGQRDPGDKELYSVSYH